MQAATVRPSRAIKSLVQGGLWSLLFSSMALFIQNLVSGPWTLRVFDSSLMGVELSLGLHFDWVSTLLFVMVTVLGTSIGHYANHFMAGEARQDYFFKYLLQAVLSVSLFVLSSNLLMLFVMWLAVEYSLHRLLLIHKERPAALYAARKRYLIGLVGDLGFLAAVVLTYFTFGTFEFSEIFQVMNTEEFLAQMPFLSVIGFLLCLVAIVQSVQFPFHFWLPETMETPTQVSALMHAGIINAGGFLIIRMSPLLQYTEYALFFLAIIGAISAVFGALIMITQNDIKSKLAYSTISQMGVMILACGLGAYSVALFHILAHSFYKATAFLSTGMLVQESKQVGFKLIQPSNVTLILMAAIGFGIVSLGAVFKDGDYLAYFTYGAILLLGLFQNTSSFQGGGYPKLLVFGKVVTAIAIALAIYFSIEYTLNQQIRGLVAVDWSLNVETPLFTLVNFAIYAIFVFGAWLSGRLMSPAGPLMQKTYIYLWNGAYLSQITTRRLEKVSRKKSRGVSDDKFGLASKFTDSPSIDSSRFRAGQGLDHNQTKEAEEKGRLLTAVVDQALHPVTPSWPLQNLIAVNPFWFLRQGRFDQVLKELAPILHARLFMPIEFYKEAFATRQIDEAALSEALKSAKEQWPEVPSSSEEFFRLSQESDLTDIHVQTVAELLKGDRDWAEVVKNDLGKYAAGYFDDSQALARFPWQNNFFWQGWLMAQEHDKAMEKQGVDSFREALNPLIGLSPQEALAFMLERMGVRSQKSQVHYMQRLLVSSLGWASRFKYFEWQESLGYPVDRTCSTVELLAVRMAYDFALFHFAQARKGEAINNWVEQFDVIGRKLGSPEDAFFRDHLIWQKASELTYQRRIVSRLNQTLPLQKPAPKYQLAFCIDVRSEVIRRYLEEEDQDIQTIGFAGFFGIPMSYKSLDARKPEYRLPALLSPSIEIESFFREDSSSSLERNLRSDDLSFSYFRNLRKAPLSSFLYVELFGILSLERILRKTWGSFLSRFRKGQCPQRFHSSKDEFKKSYVCLKENGTFGTSQKVETAKNILKHMGLVDKFGELVLIVGHGSATINNAFGSSLDCGACGGHAGDVNAQFLVEMLNDPEVRGGLAQQDLLIPERTWFVAAVHETVTDNIFLFDEEKIPNHLSDSLRHLRETMKRASLKTRKERLNAVSDALDPDPTRRSRSWSEVRPEWGLTGNASFIVAPRERTRGVNLNGRSFLHDYDWKKDEGFKTLELIMTAPMVVTNWINLQYYASTVAPQIYGAGNKTLHNLTSELGVVEGNGGDLRIGLPIQSVHDGQRFVHEPLRLSVFIEAPQREVERVIAEHETVRQLVDNEWLHILHIDSENQKVFHRQPGGEYLAIEVSLDKPA